MSLPTFSINLIDSFRIDPRADHLSFKTTVERRLQEYAYVEGCEGAGWIGARKIGKYPRGKFFQAICSPRIQINTRHLGLGYGKGDGGWRGSRGRCEREKTEQRRRWRSRSSNKPPPHPPSCNPRTHRKPRPESNSCTYIRPRFTLPWLSTWRRMEICARPKLTRPLSFSSHRFRVELLRVDEKVAAPVFHTEIFVTSPGCLISRNGYPLV